MKFFKYQALSNDFAIADEDACEMGFSSLARILCERKKGAGADGLLIFARDKKSVRIFNADGSEADMCGNGLRCCALHALRTTGKFHDALVTAAGSRGCPEYGRAPYRGRQLRACLCREHVAAQQGQLQRGLGANKKGRHFENSDIRARRRAHGGVRHGRGCRFCRFEAGFGVFGLNRQGKRGGRRHGSVRGKRKHLDCGRSAFRLRRKFLRRRFLLKRRIYGKGNLHGFGHAV